ncbi:hypothetical protein ACFPIJ_16380 [Dactylosporangium cerinum]|uniref:Gal80p-like C-terminal domain-containing protein n=1 Tax=Dactylosporangium cerinum TaxID=1434730 RepID=A0ABV9VSN0_9ACTN
MTSGAVATKSAEDQVAVTGLLESGAVAVMQFRGGTSRATGFHWEINGTQGELVVKADHSLFGGSPAAVRRPRRRQRLDRTSGSRPLPAVAEASLASCRPDHRVPLLRPYVG